MEESGAPPWQREVFQHVPASYLRAAREQYVELLEEIDRVVKSLGRKARTTS